MKDDGYYTLRNKEVVFKTIKNTIDRHLERLVHNEYISSVELHHSLLKPKYQKLLNPENILRDRQVISKKFSIPSKIHLLNHIILNWQCNDNGYLYNIAPIRNFIDVLAVKPKEIVYNKRIENKYTEHYYEILKLYRDDFSFFTASNKFIYILVEYPFLNYLRSITIKIIKLIGYAK